MKKKNKYNQDMSIDDILKSIRGIINTQKKDNHDQDEDILELTNVVGDNKHHDNLEEDSLISPKVSSDSIANLRNFAQKAKDTLNSNEKKMIGTSVEDLIIQLLRPQLKEWLDKNLTRIVEQLLEKEIKRLVPSEDDNIN